MRLLLYYYEQFKTIQIYTITDRRASKLMRPKYIYMLKNTDATCKYFRSKLIKSPWQNNDQWAALSKKISYGNSQKCLDLEQKAWNKS